jgi:hypothetical protein
MALMKLVVFSEPRRDDFLQVKSHAQRSAIWPQTQLYGFQSR